MPTTAPESIPMRIHNNGSSPAFNKRAKMYADNPKVEAKDKSISPAVTKKTRGITINIITGSITKTD